MVKRRYFYLLLLMNLLMWVGCHAEGQTTKKGKEIGMKEVRELVFAGSWYPGNPEVLSRDIQRYLGDAKKEKVEGGVVPIDVELSKKMMEKRKEIHFFPEAHSQEHSLEIQIPFLQVVLKTFKLIPIVMEPYWSWETCQYLASAIAETVKGKNVLLVASSDLSHFHSYEEAVRLDKTVLYHVVA